MTENKNSNFSFSKVTDIKPSQLAKTERYISKYFVVLSNGMHAFFNNGRYELIDYNTVKKTYFDRMPKQLSDYYFKQIQILEQLNMNLINQHYIMIN